MNIRVSENKEIVKEIRESLDKNGGYCPCKVIKTKDTKCICKEFIEQSHDGFCHCGLYYKEV